MPEPEANLEAPAVPEPSASTKGNKSTEKVAGGGPVADNLKESPMPTDAELDKLDHQEALALKDAEMAKALQASIKADQAAPEPTYLSALDKFAKLVAAGHPDTPDSYVCWGLGAIKVTMGDVRAIGQNFLEIKQAFEAYEQRKAELDA